MRNTIRTLTYIMIVLALVFVGGVVFLFTDGLSKGFSEFYVLHDNKIITTHETVALDVGKVTTFQCKYIFKSDKNNDSSYVVKVLPYVDRKKDFEFTLDNVPMVFSGIKDMSTAFDLTIDNSSFSICAPASSVQDVLEKLYPEQSVEQEVERYFNYEPMLRIEVISYDGKEKIYIDFLINQYAENIELDKGVIIW